jgi:pyridoxamine 5'-phosphate oxidase
MKESLLVELMSLAPWRSPLAHALHRNRSLPYARYLQLATVRADGRPANRTVVFRGFLDSTNQLQLITDDRSEKIAQIEHQPWSEICWYFPTTREQFRLTGKLSLISADCPNPDLFQAREQLWQSLSDQARVQFVWPNPGQPRVTEDGFASIAPDAIKPPSNFRLLLLEPTQVDHLELRGNPQNRYLYIYEKDGQWSAQEVNP